VYVFKNLINKYKDKKIQKFLDKNPNIKLFIWAAFKKIGRNLGDYGGERTVVSIKKFLMDLVNKEGYVWASLIYIYEGKYTKKLTSYSFKYPKKLISYSLIKE
jgi:hypothetical protein